MIESREIRLKARPQGMPTDECFELATVGLPEISDGEVLVRNLWMSVDPYMRGRMDDVESYIQPFQIGEPLEGGAIGQVVASKNSELAVGDFVESMLGWREYFIANQGMIDGDPANPLDGLHKRDPSLLPLQSYLGIAGMPGMTAYSGLVLLAKARAGDTVFVSGAAGAVGSTVCQIAKIKGCTVVGSAGSEKKVKWLKDTAGVDAAFNYKKVSSVSDALSKVAPRGIDVYFENVGGEHLTAAIEHMNDYGRIALCGLIADYNEPSGTEEHGLFMQILAKQVRVQGFIVTSSYDQYPKFLNELAGWIREGKIKWEETVLEGIENAPAAFLGLFSGRNTGKMLVKLADPAV